MDFEKWLAGAYGQPADAPPGAYAPDSPPFYDEGWTEEAPMGQITSFHGDNNGNPHLGYPNTSTFSIMPTDSNIDPTLAMNATADVITNVAMNNAPTLTGHAAVTVPDYLVETSSKILIHLAKVLEIPQDNDMEEHPLGELTFTEQELEDLESIPESNHDPSVPKTIDDIRVTSEPRSHQIAEIIDCKRVGIKRQVFYLARTKKENYCWFSCPRTDRDLKLNKLIGDYLYNLRLGKKTPIGKKLRSGKTIII